MNTRGQFTKEEIYSQADAWTAALLLLKAQRLEIQDLWGKFDQVIFTGCGSTYYLALSAAAVFQELTGVPARGIPASELWLYPRSSYPAEGPVLLVAVSRSGETSETLNACDAFKRSGRGTLLTLSCYPDMPLAHTGELNLVFPPGAERSVAQTRAFTTLYLASTAFAGFCAGREDLLRDLEELPKVGERILKDYTSLAVQLGNDMSLDRFYFLGSGARYGLACELSLKMKEMSLSHSEPFHFMEFRHGPKSMVTPGTLVVGLVSLANHDYETAVLADMRALGGRILEIGESGGEVAFKSGLDQAISNILYLPVGQILAFERSIAKELNPDQPHNLDTVVKLDPIEKDS